MFKYVHVDVTTFVYTCTYVNIFVNKHTHVLDRTRTWAKIFLHHFETTRGEAMYTHKISSSFS